ncbi:MAG: helix-turn-helix domain-containing protein [Chloroflexi bacterium]|nr:helix-turn-helix domain-containing protein [Chloroflexota bacterium]
MIKRVDIEAILRELLTSFGAEQDHSPAGMERYVQAGAEAIMMQQAPEDWLGSAEAADLLGISEEVLRRRVESRQIPAARDKENLPRFYRRDLILYRMSGHLGATSEDVRPLTPPVAWGEDVAELGLDPWRELTPG